MINVIVYGPQGSGKSLNARKIAKHFGLTSIHDGETIPHKLQNALILTNERPDEMVKAVLGLTSAKVYSVDEVKKLLGRQWLTL